ncbi:unnamed protein product [Rotaria socialis]|uniref:Uncharacterized protein n=3 Tax=Rotaria socialis TaxID=392032 RepID=A0A818JUY7_9BILA|nr:unnamed protein product [Rotaria socialis]CAF4577367.1 unnamed protein product [Rotaria socialis]
MSDKFVPYHLRDINNPPAHLNDKQKSNWIRTAQKAQKNYQNQQQYPAFTLPTSFYEIIYVNKFTTTETMQKLIDHVRHCHEFTFDTEGEKSNKQLALIQIQTIPQQLPCFVVLVELLHLPSFNTLIFVKIKQLFTLIFQSKNKLYSWEWPITSQIFDIQLGFSDWYTWALSHCEVCSPSLLQHNVINDVCSNTNINSSSKCTCHEASPYRPGEKWGLQDAFIYTCQLFIDKSMTISYWAKVLDPHHSTLSTITREKMLRYAIYDCFTTTYLARPVLSTWTFQKVKNINVVDLFQASSSSTSPSLFSLPHEHNTIINTNINPQILKNVIDNDLEFISEDSDDDITINQCRTIPVNNALYEQISDDDIDISIGQQQHQPSIESHSTHDRRTDERKRRRSNEPKIRRSDAARQRRNRKRNYIHRLHRYLHILVRRIYHRFTMSSIKDILRRHHIYYRHVKIVASSLIIGIKNSTLQQEFDQYLPVDLFDRNHYYHHRRHQHHYHRHQHHYHRHQHHHHRRYSHHHHREQ